MATGGAAGRHAAEPEAVIVPIDLGGPKCCEGGPSVEILRADRHLCGKGDTCTVVDLRIRNPEERALFLTDREGLLPAHGEIDMSWLGGFIADYESKKLYPLEGKERVSIGTWCVQKVPVPE